MKLHERTLLIALLAGGILSAQGEVLFTEDFESPDVSTTSSAQFGGTIDKGELPDNGNWIRSSEGFGADRLGIVNKSFGDYSAPAGNEQGFYFGYTNSGLTTSEGAISHVLQVDAVYTLAFEIARDNDSADSDYIMQLVAFDPAETDSLRDDVRPANRPGVVLASVVGTVTSNDLSEAVSLVFEPDEVDHASEIGLAVGIRFLGNSTHPILDNVVLSVEGSTPVGDGDEDDDGLPDDWEIANFGDLTRDGTGDADGDGLTDAFEYEVGLDPNDTDTDDDGNPDWVGYLTSGDEVILINEDFENPDVSGNSALQYGATFDFGELPLGGDWIGASQGFGANRTGLINKTFGDFTAGSGNDQAYYFGYTNSGLTSSTSATPHLIKAGVVYTLTFDVARDNDSASSNYLMELVAFGPGEDDAARTDARSGSKPGVVLASASGAVTSNDLSEQVTIVFVADPAIHAAEVGKAIGVRFLGNSSHPILDNVQLRALDTDTDGDGIDDNWEIANFGDLSRDGTADADGDTLSDGFEFEAGLDPNDADTDDDGNDDWIGVPGYLSIDQWDQIPGTTLADLLGSADFYQQPTASYFVPRAKSVTDLEDDYGLRMRGRLIAPYTGEYRFWIAGEGECVLYLSSDSTAFNRTQVASVPAATGEESWDEFSSQRSSLVELVEGQEYYIEVLLKSGVGPDHVAVAWEYFEQLRQVIPGSALKSYVPDAGDLDGDGMLDDWETQHGLDPTDNGGTSLAESGYSDADGDGLLNFEEYVYGGDPLEVGGNEGYLEFDVWTGLAGWEIQDLVLSADFAGQPDMRTWLGADLRDWGGNYGGRLRGTLTAPATAEYTFWISGDDQVELWLSSTSDRFSKERIAWRRTASGYQSWGDRNGTQRSASVSLTAGETYYIEALVKNESGSDHLSIGWSYINVGQWQMTDVGGALPAVWTDGLGTVEVSSVSGEVWDVSDEFAFRYLELSGDCEITARVSSVTGANGDTKAGIMIRESLAADSTNACLSLSPNGRVLYQARGSTGAITKTGGSVGPGSPDEWLRLVREGDFVIAFVSEDGRIWRRIQKRTVSMGDTIYVGLAAAGNDATAPVEATWSNISISNLDQVEVIPSSILTSISPNANDQDDDNLPDDWETSMGLDASTGANGMGEYGDPDGDAVSNYLEYRFGSDPLTPNGVPGNLTQELFYVSGGLTIHDFVRSDLFLQGPDEVNFLGSNEHQELEIHGRAQRVRGRVVAPVTGYYRFSISGRRDFEMWLSSDASKFNKSRIAWTLQENTVGAYATEFRQWDKFASQTSRDIYLEAGQEYYVEVLHQWNLAPAYVSMAWSYTDAETGQASELELLPVTQLRTYVADPDDLDDDCLPDSWEGEFGLDPADNGFSDKRQGEYGDYDNDLLTNREEWILGTDPTNADSDGDGVDDYRELNFFGSNPTLADLAPPVLRQDVDVSSFGEASGDWFANADGSVSSTVRRGFVNYTVNVTEAGIHLIEVLGRAEGSVLPLEELPIIIEIDGIRAGRYLLRSEDGGQGRVEAITPWLSVGTHTVTVTHDNHIARRTLRIDSLRLLAPAGIDENADGVPDWIASRITYENQVVVPEESLVSPVCIEGKARFFEQLAVTSEGDPLTPIQAIDSGWYVDVPLLAPEGNEAAPPTGIDFSFEDGTLGLNHDVTWKETDVLTAPDLTIRKGDSLRFTALPDLGPQNPNSIKVTLVIDGLEIASDFKASRPHIHTFDTVGEHTVEVFCRHGKTRVDGSMIVTVEDAEFGPVYDTLLGSSRDWDLPDVGEEVFIEADPRMGFVELAPPVEGGRRFRVDPYEPEERRVLARTDEGGAIIDTGVIKGYRAYRTDATGDLVVIQTFENGDQIVQMSIVAPELPPGGYIRLEIFVAGVTFLDGTIEKIITAEDIGEDGIFYVKFNFPAGTTTSVCHRIYLHDSDGIQIGRQ